jgi:hypothetical protein
MPTMPYHVEKGATISVLEDFLDDDQNLIDAVTQLRTPGSALADSPFLTSANLNAGPYPTLADRQAYLNEQWLGMTDVSGQWTPQAPFGPTNLSTGGWKRWYGQADEILRRTFVRAGELALRINHSDPLPTPPLNGNRRRIQIIWKCAQPWFEGWITWRPDSVTVILCTPGTGAKVWTAPDPYTGQPGPPPPDFERDPLTYPADYGMIVVTHEEQRRVDPPTTTAPTPTGRIPQPFHVWVGWGDVIAVQTAEKDGGVLHHRRTFQ